MDITKRTESGTLHIRMAGRFTFADNQAFRELLNEIAGASIKSVIFDMEKLEFVDSAALGMLLLAHDESSKHNKGKITLQSASGQVRKMVSIARFDQYFNIVD